jgi:Glutamyl-tRNAGlu reductase, N-terminal domain
MEQTIHLLAIDLQSVPPAARDAFAMSLDELAALSAKARTERSDIEVVVLADHERFELYTTEAARQTVYRTVLGTIVARMPQEQRAHVRTTELLGVAAAWHLMHLTSGTDGRSGVRVLGDLNDAVVRARRAGTLGAELAALFECVANAGWRIQSETTLGDRETARVQHELDRFEAERIIEEELVTWQASRASQGSVQSIPAKGLDPSYYAAAEPGSSIRLKAPRSAEFRPFAEPLRQRGVA